MCIQQVKLCCVHEGMSAQIAEIKQSSSQKYFTSTQNYFSLNLVGDTIVCWPKKDVKWFDFISHQTTSPNLIQCQQNFLLRFQIFVWNLFNREQWWTPSIYMMSHGLSHDMLVDIQCLFDPSNIKASFWWQPWPQKTVEMLIFIINTRSWNLLHKTTIFCQNIVGAWEYE